MTICIAGICKGLEDEKGRIILASDRMLTERELYMEFEQNLSKKITVNDTCLILSAGSALAPYEIEKKIRKIEEGDEDIPEDIHEIADMVEGKIKEIHQERVENQLLKPAGLEFEDLKTLANTGLGGALYKEIIEEQTVNLHLLLAGVDDSGAHIFYITDPGTKRCFDDIKFHAIGTGEGHARSSLVFNDYGSKEIPYYEALYLIYEAKKKSEKAPGVGEKHTDLWAISEDGFHKISDEELETLENIRKKRERKSKNALANIEEKLE